VFTFPEKYVGATWKITIVVAGTAATTTDTALTSAGGITATSPTTFYDLVSPANTVKSTNGASQSNWFYMRGLRQLASPGVASTATYSSCTWPTSPTAVVILVEQVNPSIAY
jgi:hypothetical protein